MAYSTAYNRRSSVNGSLAYEIGYIGGTAAPAPQPEYPAEKPSAPPIRKEYARTRPHKVPRTKQSKGISISTLLCLAVTLGMVLTLLSSYVRMIELSDQSVELKGELAELQKQNNLLKVKHESEIDLREIERYATEELGMVVPSTDAVVYVDLSEPDKAEVGDEIGGSQQLQTESVSGMSLSAVGRLLEYFR